MSTDSVTPNRTTTASSHKAAQASSPTPQVGESNRAHAADMRRRLIVSAPLGILATILSMVPAWQFTGWQWVVAAITIPVVTWGAWPFHRAAFAAGRHGSTTIDTLVSLGVIASTLWSWWALLWGGAGMLGMRMQMSLIPRAAHAVHAEIYFEVAST
ncbi:MAG: heavy metal translocating P-type ATPase, partial [Schaalia odontolytica]